MLAQTTGFRVNLTSASQGEMPRRKSGYNSSRYSFAMPNAHQRVSQDEEWLREACLYQLSNFNNGLCQKKRSEPGSWARSGRRVLVSRAGPKFLRRRCLRGDRPHGTPKLNAGDPNGAHLTPSKDLDECRSGRPSGPLVRKVSSIFLIGGQLPEHLV